MSLESFEPTRSGEHLSAFALECAAFDPHTSPPAHLDACAQCSAAVITLREERTRFLARAPAAAFAARVDEKRARRSRTRWWAGFTGLGVAAVAATLALMVWPSTDDHSIHWKGREAPRLSVLVSHAGEPARELDGAAVLHPGERLRFQVTAPRDGFLYLANIDEAGNVTRYFPQDQLASAPVRAGGQLLPGTIELDDYVGEEVLVLLFSDRPLHQDEVEPALKSAFSRSGDSISLGEIDLPATATLHRHRKVQ